MKKSFSAVAIISLMILGATLPSQADIAKGQKIYQVKMRKACSFSSVKFARSHTQSEWESIYNSGKYAQEAKKICPRLDIETIQDSWWPHVYDFTLEYASDSQKVPEL